jgi:hypothetical protein
MSLTPKQQHYIQKNHHDLTVPQIAARIKVQVAEISDYIESLSEQIPRRKRLFTALALAIPIIFFLFLEIVLRLLGYGGNLDLFIPAPSDFADYYMCNLDVGRRYFSMQNRVPEPPNDMFLKNKPENGYRIFALGGSTTAGFPYPNSITWPRILEARLADVFPKKHIEMINTAMTAVNTYTVLDFVDEIISKEPDAVLIYSGHNEFMVPSV